MADSKRRKEAPAHLASSRQAWDFAVAEVFMRRPY